MTKGYEKRIIVTSADVDMFGVCFPGQLMRYFQEVSVEHSCAEGMSRESLMEETGGVWILTRMWYKLNRPIFSKEKIVLRTDLRTPKGMFLYRDIDVLSESGEKIGEAIGCWAVLDTQKRSFLRPSSLEIFADFTGGSEKSFKLTKIKLPEVMTKAEKRKIVYSDVDINGHVNNAKYVDIACDAVGFHMLENEYVSEMQITYSRECVCGEVLDIETGFCNETYFVRGVDGTTRFEVSFSTDTIEKRK